MKPLDIAQFISKALVACFIVFRMPGCSSTPEYGSSIQEIQFCGRGAPLCFVLGQLGDNSIFNMSQNLQLFQNLLSFPELSTPDPRPKNSSSSQNPTSNIVLLDVSGITSVGPRLHGQGQKILVPQNPTSNTWLNMYAYKEGPFSCVVPVHIHV